jgi:hypothetical protein
MALSPMVSFAAMRWVFLLCFTAACGDGAAAPVDDGYDAAADSCPPGEEVKSTCSSGVCGYVCARVPSADGAPCPAGEIVVSRGCAFGTCIVSCVVPDAAGD